MADSVAAQSGKMAKSAALRKMTESCVKVSNSIVAGSDGDKDKVQSYMDSVCMQDKEGSKEATRCNKFSAALLSFMNADEEANRDDLDTAKFCEKYFKDAVETEAAEEVKRESAAAAEAKKQAEARNAEAKKKAEEEAKAKAAQERKEAVEKSKADARDTEI